VNWPADAPRVANHRALGVADLAAAVRDGRPQHASGRLASHVLEVMSAILKSGETGSPVTVADRAERPPALSEDDAALLFSS
jgi:hypothetical protein